jgi:hypothetical protein
LAGFNGLLISFFIKIFTEDNNIFDRFIFDPNFLLSDRRNSLQFDGAVLRAVDLGQL